jgi:hypothetical protein
MQHDHIAAFQAYRMELFGQVREDYVLHTGCLFTTIRFRYLSGIILQLGDGFLKLFSIERI